MIQPPLRSTLASSLFETVERFPIIDWHNHLSIQDLACNRQFEDPAQLWLLSDPYKHRAMRICGVPEALITGTQTTPVQKFQAWCSIFPELVGNPLYFWTGMELEQLFGIRETPNAHNASRIWDAMTERLQEPEFSAQGLLRQFHVEYAAPCVSTTDSLDAFPNLPNVVPSFRGDDLVALAPTALQALAKQSSIPITSLTNLKQASVNFLNALHALNCRFSDHAIDGGFAWLPDDGKNDARFDRLLQGTASPADRQALACEMLRFLANEYAARGWTLQLHVGALRSTSSRLRRLAGPAGGYAAIAHPVPIQALTQMLDCFEAQPSGLPNTILYTLNPADHALFAVLSGSFNGAGVRGKVQLGPAWWYCDHAYAIRDCLESITAYGVLSTFLGMTTDSRSLLSFVRHAYFRRVLCNWLAAKAEAGEMSDNQALLHSLAMNICYSNAHKRITP